MNNDLRGAPTGVDFDPTTEVCAEAADDGSFRMTTQPPADTRDSDRMAAARLAAEVFYGTDSNWSHFDNAFRELWCRVVDAACLAKGGKA